MITKATEYAKQINKLLSEGKNREANDLLMHYSEKLSKDSRVGYSDAKQMIWFCMGR